MASPTCLQRCAEQLVQTKCEAMAGCSWAFPLQGASEGYCQSGSPGSGSLMWVGIVLSLLGNIIINIGMNCMKHAHNINTDENGDPIKHFARIPWWWGGVLGIVGGEVANIVAYGYAPASIVTPMGAVGVLTNVFITSYALGEPFRAVQCVGLAFVIAGIVLVVYYAPETYIPIQSVTIWDDWIYTKEFVAYLGTFCLIVPASLLASSRWGHRSVVFYLLTCASIASLTIVSAKTFSTLLAAGIEKGPEDWLGPAPYVALFLMATTAVASMSYVNKAMMVFGNSLVVPTYYAFFTTFSVGSVAWVYREFDCLISPLQIGLFLGGAISTVSGVALLQFGAPPVALDDHCDENQLVQQSRHTNNGVLGVPFMSSMDQSGMSSTSSSHNHSRFSAIWGSSFTGAALHYSVDTHRTSVGGHRRAEGHSIATRMSLEAGLLSVNQSSIMERSALASPMAASYKRWVPIFEAEPPKASRSHHMSRSGMGNGTPSGNGGGFLTALPEEPKQLWGITGMGRRESQQRLSLSPATSIISHVMGESKSGTPVSAGEHEWVVTAVTAETVYGMQGVDDTSLATQQCLFPPSRPASPLPAVGLPFGLPREVSSIPRHSSSSFPGLDSTMGGSEIGSPGAHTSRNVSPVPYTIRQGKEQAGRISLKNVRVEAGGDVPLGVPVAGAGVYPAAGAKQGLVQYGVPLTEARPLRGQPASPTGLVQYGVSLREAMRVQLETVPASTASPIAPPVPPRRHDADGGRRLFEAVSPSQAHSSGWSVAGARGGRRGGVWYELGAA